MRLIFIIYRGNTRDLINLSKMNSGKGYSYFFLYEGCCKLNIQTSHNAKNLVNNILLMKSVRCHVYWSTVSMISNPFCGRQFVWGFLTTV